MELKIEKAINQSLQNDINKSLIFQTIRRLGGISRSELAHKLQASRSTISRIIDALIKDGYIEEGSKKSTSPVGKKSSMLYLSPSLGSVLSIDLSYGKFLINIRDFNANNLETVNLGDIDGSIQGLDTHLDKLRYYITKYSVKGVGIGIPGEVNPKDFAINLCLFEQWNGLNLQQYASDRLNIPVIVERDIFLSAICENYYEPQFSGKDALYVKVSKDISTAFVSGDRLFRGFTGSAGQTTFSLINPSSEAYKNGSRGYLDEVASFDNMIEPNSCTFVTNQEQRQFILDLHSKMLINTALVINPEVIVFTGLITSIEDLEPQYILPLQQKLIENLPTLAPKLCLSRHANESVHLGLVKTVLDHLISEEFPYLSS